MRKEHVGYAIAILSIIASGIISWYFYDRSQQYRVPAYFVEPFSGPVFRAAKGRRFPFTVVDRDGNKISKSIYLATHYFWNKGECPILRSDILEPLVITLNGDDINILNATISRYSRAVVGCNADQISRNQIRLTYNVLEEGDGCAIDLIYIGDEHPEIGLAGTILGVNSVEIYSESLIDYLTNLPWYDRYRFLVPGFVVFVAYSVVVVLYLRLRNEGRYRFWRDAIIYIVFVGQLFFITETKVALRTPNVWKERPNISHWMTASDSSKSLQSNANSSNN